jgi:hypothetical protein
VRLWYIIVMWLHAYFNSCFYIRFFMLLIHSFNCEGLARATKTRHLLIVRYHKRRQTLRSMLSWIFQTLLLMKLTMVDRTQKVLNFCMSCSFSLVHFVRIWCTVHL